MGQHSFQEVMKQWVRVRKATKCHGEENNMLSVYPLEAYDDTLIADIEKTVMAWAAENPEPVYPTWSEYLHTQVKSHTVLRGFPDPDCVLDDLLHTSISADIAQKLGLKPKEGA